MFKPIQKAERVFIDEILKFLSPTYSFIHFDSIYSAICFESNDTRVFNVKLPFIKLREFIPKGSEIDFLKDALGYLVSEGLLTKVYDDYKITYKGLLLSKNGGFSKKYRNENIKTYLQNAVWVVTLIAFGYTSFSFVFYYNYDKNTNQTLKQQEQLNKEVIQEVRQLKLQLKDLQEKYEVVKKEDE